MGSCMLGKPAWGKCMYSNRLGPQSSAMSDERDQGNICNQLSLRIKGRIKHLSLGQVNQECFYSLGMQMIQRRVPRQPLNACQFMHPYQTDSTRA